MDNPLEVVTQVGHDLNKYLARIKAYNYLLLHRFEKKLNEEEKSFFEGIDKECESMNRLISDLVVAEKVSGEDEHDVSETIAFHEFIRTISQRYQVPAQLKGVSLQIDLHAPSVSVKVHRDSFERAINNLIHNALKFTPRGGNIRMGWSLCTCQQYMDFTIADSGIGIPAHLQPYIFDKFTKAGRKGLEGEDSNGLGMFITKNIIEKSGGRISFESKEESGTKFFIKLPIVSSN